MHIEYDDFSEYVEIYVDGGATCNGGSTAAGLLRSKFHMRKVLRYEILPKNISFGSLYRWGLSDILGRIRYMMIPVKKGYDYDKIDTYQA